jgi:hypothetical protein
MPTSQTLWHLLVYIHTLRVRGLECAAARLHVLLQLLGHVDMYTSGEACCTAAPACCCSGHARHHPALCCAQWLASGLRACVNRSLLPQVCARLRVRLPPGCALHQQLDVLLNQRPAADCAHASAPLAQTCLSALPTLAREQSPLGNAPRSTAAPDRAAHWHRCWPRLCLNVLCVMSQSADGHTLRLRCAAMAAGCNADSASCQGLRTHDRRLIMRCDRRLHRLKRRLRYTTPCNIFV